jgi:hypothetical protein
MEWILGILAGAALGGTIVFIWHQSRSARTHSAAANALARAELLDEQSSRQQEEIAELRRATDEIDARREAAERTATALLEKLAARDNLLRQEKELREEMEKRLADTRMKRPSRRSIRCSSRSANRSTSTRSRWMRSKRSG